MTYSATAHREESFWVIDIEGVGTTQARSISEARRMAADLILAIKDVIGAEVTVEFTGGLLDEVAQIRSKRAQAEQLSAEASAEMRDLVGKLVDSGISGADIAHILGVSPQRTSQLASEVRPRNVRARAHARLSSSG